MTLCLTFFLIFYLLHFVSSQCTNWVISDSDVSIEASYTSIAVDNTGQNMIASVTLGGNLYFSQDYGITWNLNYDMVSDWVWTALNGNGSLMLAADPIVLYYSVNYGQSFVASSFPVESPFRMTVNDVGNISFCCPFHGTIYKSIDYAQTWNITTNFTDFWTGIAVDKTGQYVAACSNSTVYVSDDFGDSWQSVLTSDLFGVWFKAITSDSTGQYLATVVYSWNIYVSHDFGSTWFTAGPEYLPYKTITSSSSGQYLYAGAQNIQPPFIYTSADYGVTWTNVSVPISLSSSSNNYDWVSLSSNADGSVVGGTVAGGPINICAFNPSSMPSLPPSASDDGRSLQDTIAPIVVSAVAAFVSCCLGVIIAFLHNNDKQSFAILYHFNYSSVCYSFAVFGCSFVSQLFFAYACFSRHLYFTFGLCWITVKVLGLVISMTFIAQRYIRIEDTLFDWEHFGRSKRMYMIILLFAVFQPTFCRFLPWISNDVAAATGGFPTYEWYVRCSAIQVLEAFALVTVQIVFVAYFTFSRISFFTQASLLISILSTSMMGFVVLFESILVRSILTRVERKKSTSISMKTIEVKNPIAQA
jgi:hypothetical protein